jgi:hypothetical protein
LFPSDRSKKALGISVGERSLLVAQVALVAGAPQVSRVAEFQYPTGLSLEQGQALGEALRGFLDSAGFAARRVIVGVPAKWLILRSHKIPPADTATAIALLGMQVEAQHVAELGEVVYDFVGECSATEPSAALLMGLSRRWLDRVLAMAQGARLKVVAVTPCTAVLAAATAARCDRPLVLSLRSEGGELAAAEGSQTRFLRHLGSGVSTVSLGMELRRAAALLPAGFGAGNGQASAGGNGQSRIVLWDDVGLDAPAIQLLQEALGIPLVRGELPALGGTGCGLADGRVGGRAVALAISLLERRRPAVDFLHPRLVPPKPSRIPRRALWFSTAGMLALIALALGYGDLSRLQRQVGDLEGQLQQLGPALGPARPFVSRMKFAEAFREGDPRFLACLRDLTMALPASDRTYLTTFRLQDNMQGEVSGKSDSAQELIKMVDALNAGSRFSDIKRSLDGRGAATGVSFKVTFTYAPRR